jgi:hypothetical protein
LISVAALRAATTALALSFLDWSFNFLISVAALSAATSALAFLTLD